MGVGDMSEAVIGPITEHGGQRGTTLVVDQHHPFFFDHPLDHVSGILLITGLLDLVRASADPYLGGRNGRNGRVRLSFEFARICELDAEVLLTAEPGDIWKVRATQDGHTVCAGSVELVEHGMPPLREPAQKDEVAPIEQGLVHRADRHNVVVAEPTVATESYEVPLVTPPAGHFLLRHGDERYGIEEIVESGRQLLTAAGALAHDRPEDRMLWRVLTADLPTGAIRQEPLALHWPVTPPRGNTAVFDYTVVAHGSGATVGTLSYVVTYATPAAYDRLRGRAR